MEASLAGLPVISTNHGGIPDVILHEKTGFLVDEHDIANMISKMILLLEDKEKARCLGQNGKSQIASNFSFNSYVEKIKALL